MQRDVLPMPDRPHEGLITYDAKDPASSFPPIEPLRPPAGAPNVLIVLLDDANIFVNDKRYIFTNLNTLGWVLILLGVIQLGGGFSLMAGNTFGRVLGIVGGSLGAIGALLSIGGSYPWWNLGIFFLCVYVVYGILVFGEDETAART